MQIKQRQSSSYRQTLKADLALCFLPVFERGTFHDIYYGHWRPCQLHTFPFPAVGNNKMADAQTSEAGGTVEQFN
jgi:hypothetical protein